ncbi:methyltransferase type 11 [Streptomyces mashuensis]|uniref:Methyltransferase type 11 n=1 Tax=Streptomyces mashuensis TaxID=33904 RepID=A0A919B5C6_9ACTN|nr:class I SAM-dependent methyltransferase [Streptomyces mashuensis]GHF54803.1 methyltransferase type 11 [Streptomyces mashuensis]
MAESFGSDPDRYDRTRPRYPDALVQRIAAACPGPAVLDVGCGTGIAARQFQAAGCDVLGIDPDPRMAGFAQRRGLDVEVARFETWEPAGRVFDAVVAGQTWHWVDPVAGAAKAAGVLRPDGRLAVFWNVFLPSPDVAEAFSAVHRRVLPDLPRNPWAATGLDAYAPFFTRTTDGIRRTGAFTAPEQWRYDWEQSYTRDAWLSQMRTSGEAGLLPPERLAELLDATARAVDAMGGSFTMQYAAVAVTATRTDGRGPTDPSAAGPRAARP